MAVALLVVVPLPVAVSHLLHLDFRPLQVRLLLVGKLILSYLHIPGLNMLDTENIHLKCFNNIL